MKNYFFKILVLSLLTLNLNGQDKLITNNVKYEKGFVFEQGIYFTFEDFKLNRPIPFENIESKKKQPLDFRELFDQEMRLKNSPIEIFTNDTIIKCDLREIWGYSNGKNIYINSKEKGLINEKQTPEVSFYGKAFHVDISRVVKIGSICHFTDFDEKGFVPKNPMFPNKTVKSGEYIIKMATGKIYNFDIEGMSIALEDDDELLTLFLKESNKKKKDKLKVVLYKFLNLYNEKHPIYFPT